jgi:hypothetical protein
MCLINHHSKCFLATSLSLSDKYLTCKLKILSLVTIIPTDFCYLWSERASIFYVPFILSASTKQPIVRISISSLTFLSSMSNIYKCIKILN